MNENITILLVEDDPLNQIIVGTYAKKWGFDLTIADTGHEAVELIKQKTFHVILMDIFMPLMDGFQTSSVIRAIDGLYFQTVPIIAFTASILAHIRGRAMQHGMTDLMAKPFEPDSLRIKIEEHAKRFITAAPMVFDAEPAPLKISA